MIDKPCVICEGKGHFLKPIVNTENAESNEFEKIICEACKGTGSAMIQMFGAYNRQLKDMQQHHNDILHELRKKRYEAFSDLKKNN